MYVNETYHIAKLDHVQFRSSESPKTPLMNVVSELKLQLDARAAAHVGMKRRQFSTFESQTGNSPKVRVGTSQ